MSSRAGTAEREPIRDRGERDVRQRAGASVPAWRRATRLVAFTLALGGTLPVVTAVGYYRMFTRFSFWDDEGCVLITLKSFMDGHPLYDDVFSMYGPFPILLRWLIFTVSGTPVGHDVGRLIALGYWLAAAVLCAAAAWRLTQSIVAAWTAGLLVFFGLNLLVQEPGHPQDLCAVLLALAVFLGTFVGAASRRRPALLMTIGIVAGCLGMTKINIFVFLAMALGGAVLSFIGRTWVAAALKVLYAVGLLIAPALLMRGLWMRAPFQSYALHVTLALVPILVLTIGRPVRAMLGVRDCVWIGAGLVASTAVIAAVVLLHGTTPAGLLDGVLLTPLRAGVLFFSPQYTFLDRWPIPVAFIVAAMAWLLLERTRLASRLVSTFASALLRIGYGMFCLYWMPPLSSVPYEHLLVYGAPGAVLLLIGCDPMTGCARHTFGRVFLAFLSVTEVMWAYPVTGSQLSFAIFLPVLALVVIAADGCRDLAALCAQWARWPTWIAARLGQAAVIVALALPLRAEYDWWKREYEQRQPLDLPGAHAIRLDAKTVNDFRQLATSLHDLPDSFFTLPGLYSVYFWSGQEPPTALTLTNWMYMLDDRQQERIIAQIAPRSEMRVVYTPHLVEFWMKGNHLWPSPLVRYIDDNFAPVAKVAGSEIWVRQPAPRPPDATPRLPIKP